MPIKFPIRFGGMLNRSSRLFKSPWEKRLLNNNFRVNVVKVRPYSAAVAELQPTETVHVKSEEQFLKTFDANSSQNLCSLVFDCNHTPGSLQRVISLFEERELNLRRIESKPSTEKNAYTILVDVEAAETDPRVQSILEQQENPDIHLSPPRSVPWFPQHVSDLDKFSTKTLDAGSDLESDHPGFLDQEYRSRRAKIVNNAQTYRFGAEIPRVEYSRSEVETWGHVYRKLTNLYQSYACKEFLDIFALFEKHVGYSETNIPQLEDISKFLQQTTGFRLRPVSGLLSARDFLNALAFRTFFSTQYIRHYSKPFYTPEPDICHELMGHVPMFADPNFADFSQTIGLASLGASDNDIKRLATCYWFSVEFGLLKERSNGECNIKAYGAGLLSSSGELVYSTQGECQGEIDPSCISKEVVEDGKPSWLKWRPEVAAETEYPITTYQPLYFVAESLEDAKMKMKHFCENEINRPFHVKFDPITENVVVDRNVSPVKSTETVQEGV